MISALYVDDEPVLLDIGKLFLEKDGDIKVDTASSQQEALIRIKESTYDVIISDFEMPLGSGIELLKILREQDNDIPFILFTGRGREEVAIEALNNGADYYLQKGGSAKVQFAELIHKIRLAVERKRNISALKFSEQRLYNILNFLPEATFAINQEGLLILWNKAMEKLTGVSALQVIGKGNYEHSLAFYKQRKPILIDLIENPNLEIEDNYTYINKNGEILTAEAEIVTDDGRSRYFWGKVSPLFDQDGSRIGAIETIHEVTEKKVAELNNVRLASIVENSDDAISILSLDGRISSWNTSAEKIYGYSVSEAIGRDYSTFFKDAENIEVISVFKKILNGETPTHFEVVHITKNGDEKMISLAVSPIRNTRGDITNISIIGRDITEIKKAEISLISSEKRFRDLFELNKATMFIVDPESGEILRANNAASRYYGYSPEEMMKINIKQINISPPEIIHNNMQLTKGSYGRTFEFQHRKKSGEICDVEVFSAPIMQGEKKVLHSIIFDVSEKKKMAKALLESEERYRKVVEDQTDMICRYLPDGTYTFVNEVYCRYFNTCRANILKLKFSPEIYEDDKELYNEYLKSIPFDGASSLIEYRVIMPDNQIRWHQWNTRRILNEKNETVEFQSVGRDITEKKLAENEILEKNIELQVAYDQITSTEEELRQNYQELSVREEDLNVTHEQLKVIEEELRQQYDDIVIVQQELRESEKNFRMMVDSAPDAIYITDGEVFLFVNVVMVNLLGAHSPRDLVGKPIWDRISPEYRKEGLDRVHSVLLSRDPADRNETIYLRLDDTPVYVESTASSIRFENRVASLVFLRDISEYQMNREVLRKNEEKYRALIETTRTGYVITDLSGIVLDANGEYVRLSGHTNLLEILGKNVLEWTREDYRDTYQNALEKCTNNGHISAVELWYKGNDSINTHVEMNATAISDGKTWKIVAIFRSLSLSGR